jgi:hypothetical protein
MLDQICQQLAALGALHRHDGHRHVPVDRAVHQRLAGAEVIGERRHGSQGEQQRGREPGDGLTGGGAFHLGAGNAGAVDGGQDAGDTAFNGSERDRSQLRNLAGGQVIRQVIGPHQLVTVGEAGQFFAHQSLGKVVHLPYTVETATCAYRNGATWDGGG